MRNLAKIATAERYRGNGYPPNATVVSAQEYRDSVMKRTQDDPAALAIGKGHSPHFLNADAAEMGLHAQIEVYDVMTDLPENGLLAFDISSGVIEVAPETLVVFI